jgi:tight adherence protein C
MPGSRFPALVLGLILALPLLGLAVPRPGQAAPATRDLRINQVRSYEWPKVVVNFNLKSLNSTALGPLDTSQFAIEENGVAQQVTGVALGHDINVPLSVVLVMDTSGSMQGPKLDAAKAAAIAFMDSLIPTDQVAFIAFNTKVQAPVPFTTDHTTIATAINKQVAKGNTAIYDALYVAARVANNAPQGNRRAIVLLTDGNDTASLNTLVPVAGAAREASALVYTIGLGADTDDKALRQLAESASGRYSKAPNPSDLQAIYVELARELAGQYLLTYTSTTHTHKVYETVGIRFTYKSPTGETIVREFRYRPPASALLQEAPPATFTPVPDSGIAPPPGVIFNPPQPPPAATLNVPRKVDTGLLPALAGFLAAIAVLTVFGGIMLLSAPSAVSTRLDRFVAAPEIIGLQNAPPAGFATRVLMPFFNSVGGRLGAFTPSGYLDQIQKLLYQAGPPYRMSRIGFLGVQAGFAIGLMVLLEFWAISSNAPLLQLLGAAVLGIFLGAYLPYFQLVRRVTQRKKKILRALPGALDFLAIMVEAGTGFDTALNELVRRWQNTLTDEFALLLVDFQIGKPRREAWRDLTVRTAVPELNSFVVAMLQSEQTGGSISGLLRTQSDQMRIRRRQRAEEEARMAPVKMLIPMALFIFPCILIIILGPAIPQIFGSFGSVGK